MEDDTFKIGQLFRVDRSAYPYILVAHSNSEGRPMCCLIGLANGNRFAGSIRMGDMYKITAVELSTIADQKKVEYICPMPYVPIIPSKETT